MTRGRKKMGVNVRRDEVPCKVEGCARHAHYSSGLCAMHHRRLQRKGEVGAPDSPREPKTRVASQ